MEADLTQAPVEISQPRAEPVVTAQENLSPEADKAAEQPPESEENKKTHEHDDSQLEGILEAVETLEEADERPRKMERRPSSRRALERPGVEPGGKP